MKVKDVMVKDVATVTPNALLKDVATILIDRGISGVPVVGSVRDVLGVVSEADILMKQREPSPRRSRLLGLVAEPVNAEEIAKLKARTAGDAMTTPAITIDPESSLADAAGLMVDRGVNRLPVVENGKLVGIITRADLVRAFNRGDAEIEREIREDVIVGFLYVPPDKVDVAVNQGEVTLTGTVENETDAGLLVNAVRGIPGVVSVKSSLAWPPA